MKGGSYILFENSEETLSLQVIKQLLFLSWQNY